MPTLSTKKEWFSCKYGLEKLQKSHHVQNLLFCCAALYIIYALSNLANYLYKTSVEVFK